MRVRVDRQTLAPLGIPEFLGGDKVMDDRCLEEDSGVAYVATHRENTIDRMSLEPDRSDERESVAGSPFNAELVEPSSGAWGRAPGEAPPRKNTHSLSGCRSRTGFTLIIQGLPRRCFLFDRSTQVAANQCNQVVQF
jgi:hypothetical protein